MDQPRYLRKRPACIIERPPTVKRVKKGPKPKLCQCYGRTKSGMRRRCRKKVVLEESAHCPKPPLELPELPDEIWRLILGFYILQKPSYLPQSMMEVDERVAPWDCLAILFVNKYLQDLAKDLLSSRLSANFSVCSRGILTNMGTTEIFKGARPPLLRRLRFRVILEGDSGNQSRSLASTLLGTTWIGDIHEVQLDFETDFYGTSVEKVMGQMRNVIGALKLPPGPVLRITAYLFNAQRIFPLDGVSSGRKDFEQWVSTYTGGDD